MSRRISSALVLDPDAVRRRASSIAGCVEIASPSTSKKLGGKSFGSKLSSPSKINQTSNSSIVSFVVGVVGPKATPSRVGSKNIASNNTSSGSVEDLARVTIYCDTGTIATARVTHNGIIRHVFRRNVTSLDVVERCLKYPATIPKIDWQLVSMTDTTVIHDNGENATTSREKSIKQNLELCDVGLAILQSEREKLVLHANSLANNRSVGENSSASAAISPKPMVSQPNSSVKANNSSFQSSGNASRQQPQHSVQPQAPFSTHITSPNGVPATTSGMEFQFSLAERPMKHVDQCLTDIQKMNKIVHAVSTNGIGTVFLYGNGGVAYTPNIPRTLYQKLSQLRYSKVHSSRPQYVSLGSRERYFVAFHDGTVSYKGPKGLDKELRKLTPPTSSSSISGSSSILGNSGPVPSPNSGGLKSSASAFMNSSNNTKPLWPLRSVAFGSSYDTFCIVFQDGSFRYQGKSFPKELEEILLNPSSSLSVLGSKNHQRSNNSRIKNGGFFASSNYGSERRGGTGDFVRASDDDGDDYPPDRFNSKKDDQNAIQMSRQYSNTSTASSVFSTAGGGRSGVTCINLGPSGEWFLRTDDGRMEWGGISEEMDEAIQQLLEDGHRLNYFDFGEDSSYFVSYD